MATGHDHEPTLESVVTDLIRILVASWNAGDINGCARATYSLGGALEVLGDQVMEEADRREPVASAVGNGADKED